MDRFPLQSHDFSSEGVCQSADVLNKSIKLINNIFFLFVVVVSFYYTISHYIANDRLRNGTIQYLMLYVIAKILLIRVLLISFLYLLYTLVHIITNQFCAEICSTAPEVFHW